MKAKKVDMILGALTAALMVVGFLIFSSASMGLLSRTGASYSLVLIKQAIILGGGVLFSYVIATRIHYTVWKQYAAHIFIFALVLCVLIFIPHIGFSAGGARRWLRIGSITVQPSEFLKLGLVLFLASWFSRIKQNIQSFTRGFLPFIGIIGLAALLLLKQPDTGTYMVMFFASVGLFIAAGGKWKHLAVLGGVVVVAGFVLVQTRPYVKERILTFLDPSHDALGSSYQLRQSLIAIGSGGFMGRGFGQSVQKFNYLPEPIGDSIFAVLAEDFGFIGASGLVILYLVYGLRGLKMSEHAHDSFGRLLGIGIVILITSQAAVNIGSMTGIIPLTGVPLPFVSHGGTALLIACIEAGILLNISKYSQHS